MHSTKRYHSYLPLRRRQGHTFNRSALVSFALCLLSPASVSFHVEQFAVFHTVSPASCICINLQGVSVLSGGAKPPVFITNETSVSLQHAGSKSQLPPFPSRDTVASQSERCFVCFAVFRAWLHHVLIGFVLCLLRLRVCFSVFLTVIGGGWSASGEPCASDPSISFIQTKK